MVLQEGHQLLCCLAESKLQLKQSAWKDPHRGGAVFKVLNEDDIGHGNDEKGEEVEKEDGSVDWNRGKDSFKKQVQDVLTFWYLSSSIVQQRLLRQIAC